MTAGQTIGKIELVANCYSANPGLLGVSVTLYHGDRRKTVHSPAFPTDATYEQQEYIVSKLMQVATDEIVKELWPEFTPEPLAAA